MEALTLGHATNWGLIPNLIDALISPRNVVLSGQSEFSGQHQWGNLSHGPFPAPPKEDEVAHLIRPFCPQKEMT